jgi:hypothetical protein
MLTGWRLLPVLAIRRPKRNDQPAMTGSPARRDRRLVAVLVATALCYLIGYPVALVGHSAVGWAFVSLGGPLLIILGVMVVRRMHAGPDGRPNRDTADDR